MADKIIKYGLGVLLVIFIITSVWLFFSNRSLQNELTQQILDNNKIGYELKLSENALMSVGYIYKDRMDSLIAAGDKRVDSVIKANKENPIIITKWKTTTIIDTVKVPTYPDKDSTYRIAEIKDNNNWYSFKSRYQIVSPFNFTLERLSMIDYYQIITTKRPDNRIAVYITNKNPFVHIDSSETLIDPVLITQTSFIEKPETWKWNIILMTNVKNKNNNWFDNIDLNGAVYSPFGIGITTGMYYMRNIDKIDLKVGIGYLRDF